MEADTRARLAPEGRGGESALGRGRVRVHPKYRARMGRGCGQMRMRQNAQTYASGFVSSRKEELSGERSRKRRDEGLEN